jgi:hypothetical protein
LIYIYTPLTPKQNKMEVFIQRTLTGYVFISSEGINTEFCQQVKSNQKRLYVIQNPFPEFMGFDFATGDDSGEIQLYNKNPYYFSGTSSVPEEAIVPYELSNRTSNPKEAELIYLLNRQAEQRENSLLSQLSTISFTLLQSNIIPDPPVAKPQERISKLVISDAIEKGDICPISLTPLTLETSVCVAPCYHVFSKEAITEWMKEKKICPSCRISCSL